MDSQTLRKEIQRSSRLNIRYKTLWDQYSYLVLKKSSSYNKLKTDAFKPSDIALIFESFSKVRVSNTYFFKTLLKIVKDEAEKFDLRNISVLFNALAKIGRVDDGIFDILLPVALNRITNTTSEKDLAILLNALEQLGVDFMEIAIKSAILFTTRVNYMSNCQTLSMLFHSYSKISTELMDESDPKTELLTRIKTMLFDRCAKLIRDFKGFDFILLFRGCNNFSQGQNLQRIIVNRICNTITEFKSHELVIIYNNIYKKYPEKIPHLLNELYHRLDDLSINHLFELIQILDSQEMIRQCFNSMSLAIKKPWPSRKFVVDIMAWANYNKFIHPTNEHAMFFEKSFNYIGSIKISTIANKSVEREILKTASWLRLNYGDGNSTKLDFNNHAFGESTKFKYDYVQIPSVSKIFYSPKIFEKYLLTGKPIRIFSISPDKDPCIVPKQGIIDQCLEDLKTYLSKVYPSEYSIQYEKFGQFKGYIMEIKGVKYAIAFTDATNGNFGYDVLYQLRLVKQMGYRIYNIFLPKYYIERSKKLVNTHFSLLLIDSNEIANLNNITGSNNEVERKVEKEMSSISKFKCKLVKA